MWVRGLKPVCHQQKQQVRCVAPYVGAWIETPATVCIFEPINVAPYVGAWIETNSLRHVVQLFCRTLCGCVD